MYSLMHLRCLVFKLHKIIGQRSFQICTGSRNLKLSDFNETYLRLFVLTCETFKINGGHLENATICGISGNCSLYILVSL